MKLIDSKIQVDLSSKIEKAQKKFDPYVVPPKLLGNPPEVHRPALIHRNNILTSPTLTADTRQSDVTSISSKNQWKLLRFNKYYGKPWLTGAPA